MQRTNTLFLANSSTSSMGENIKPLTIRIIPLLLLFCLLLKPDAAQATSVVIPSDDEMIIGARTIVRGRVLAIDSQLDRQGSEIFTYVTIRVSTVFKSTLSVGTVVLKQPGGQVGNRITHTFGIPTFTPGEDVLVYLDTWADGSLRVHQMFLGKFAIFQDAQTGKEFITRSSPVEEVSVLGKSPKGEITDRLPLDDYLNLIQSHITINQQKSKKFEKKFYGHTPIRAVPPDYVATAGGQVRPQFRLPLDVGAPRWHQVDDGQPLVFYTLLDGAPNPQVMNDLAAAMTACSSVPNSKVRVISGGTVPDCDIHRTEKWIFFNNCGDFFPPSPGCAGIVATTSLSWSGADERIINGTIFWGATHTFIAFNPYSSCNLDTPCKVQETATHEIGHSLGLAHSWEPRNGGQPTAVEQAATMFYLLHFDGRCASLTQDDKNGIAFIYPENVSLPPLDIVTGTELAAATTGAGYEKQLEATGGLPPYSWNLVPQQGALPTGLSVNQTGLVSGTPATAGSFGFAMQIRDSATHTVTKNFTLEVVDPLTITTARQLPTAFVNKPYSIIFTPFGGTPSYYWSLASGSAPLPTGLSLSQAGEIKGVPESGGTFAFLIQVRDEKGREIYKEFLLEIKTSVSPLEIETSAIVSAVLQKPFSFSLKANGGIPPYRWQVTSGTIPTGLLLDESKGEIAGMPQVSGNFRITFTVSDQQSLRVSKELQLSVIDPGPTPRITKVKYKAGAGKLLINGENFAADAHVFVDGKEVVAKFDEQFVVKRLALEPGTHMVKVISKNGVESAPVAFEVQ